MARSTRTNFAKAKIWTDHMTSEIEGTIAGVSLMTFQSISGQEDREKVLSLMQEWHTEATARELERAQ